MKPLIDSDILLYEIGFSSETKDDGVITPRSWDFAQGLLDERIKLICDEVEATEPPLLFLTNTKRINKLLNKQRKREDAPPKEYVENFRVEAAKEKEYKGNLMWLIMSPTIVEEWMLGRLFWILTPRNLFILLNVETHSFRMNKLRGVNIQNRRPNIQSSVGL